MNRCFATAIAVAVSLAAAPGTGRAEAERIVAATAERIALPAGLDFPNGIASASDGTLYVGGVTSGRVWRRSPDGRWTVLFPGAPEVYAVTSLRLDESRGLLWGASPDAAAMLGVQAGRAARPHRVFAIDVRTGALRTAVVVPDGGFGNDLALDGKGGLYVTDSRRGRVLLLAADGRTWSIVADGPLLRPGDGIGPAGVARLPSGDLVVGLFGRGELVRVSRPGPNAELRPITVDRPLLRPDGLAPFDERSVLLAVGGTGEVLLIDIDSGVTRVVASGLRGPVNVDVRAGRAFVTGSGIVDPATFDPTRPDPAAASVVSIPLEKIP